LRKAVLAALSKLDIPVKNNRIAISNIKSFIYVNSYLQRRNAAANRTTLLANLSLAVESLTNKALLKELLKVLAGYLKKPLKRKK